MKLTTSSLQICFFIVYISLCVVSAQICFGGNFRPNSTYDINRRLILSSLPSNVIANNGFYNASIGQDPNKIYIIGMCIPGTKPDNCSDCIKDASDGLLQSCPNQTEAYTWPECCMVRYSNLSFSGSLLMEPSQAYYNTGDMSMNLTVFDRIWEGLMNRTIRRANEGSLSRHKYFATDIASLTRLQTIYTMMQCTPDLSSWDCEICLRRNVGDYESCCRGKQGGAVIRPSCFIRWDLYPYSGAFEYYITLLPPDPQSLPQPPVSPDQGNITDKGLFHAAGKTNRLGTIIGVVIGTTIIILLLALAFVVCRRRNSYNFFTTKNAKRSRHTFDTAPPQDDTVVDDITSTGTLQFDFKAIEVATSNFSPCNKLGQGGFGEVYKGMFPNGVEVAVKRLSKTSDQGEVEFKNEVVLVAKLQHRNLVRLLGFSLQGGEEKILVYEFVPNKSLDYFLFDPTKSIQLNWTARYNIIGGITRGILYLHQDSRLTIIHRDIKASNILLDADMNPKIADFGMARNFRDHQTEANTRRVVGTFGYMSPEYVTHGQFSTKSDVYSFGVLILEIVSGKKNSSFYQTDGSICNLVTYVWRIWSNDSCLEVIDPVIRESYTKDEVVRCIHIGLLCVQETPADRPSMSTIFQMLTNSSVTLPVPRSPGFFFRNRPELDRSEVDKSVPCSIDNASITKLAPR